MNKQEAKAFIDTLPDDAAVSILIGMATPGEDPGDNGGAIPSVPDVRRIQVTEGESFKTPDYYNDEGLPVMKTAEGGWKSEVGEIYLARVDFYPGDSGSRWMMLWKGPHTISESAQWKASGYYLNKKKVKYL